MSAINTILLNSIAFLVSAFAAKETQGWMRKVNIAFAIASACVIVVELALMMSIK